MIFLNVFEVIILSSLIGSLIVLMILIIKGILKNKLNFTFHYYIWLILIIKLIIPFGPQNSLNVSNLYTKFHVQSTTHKSTQLIQTNSSREITNVTLSHSKLTSTNPSSNENLTSKTINPPLKYKVNIEILFCFIWMFGSLLSLCILIMGYKKLNNIIRTSIKNINNSQEIILNKCTKAMNISTDIKLLYSEKVSSPSLCGLINPKIIIPARIADNVCDKEFKYIIMHELTHFKNKDILINWAITLLSVIYWFNPILLYAFHKMRQDCEISCDGKVISYLGIGENIQYGNTIIKVLELGGKNNRLIGTTSMILNSLEMKRRIIMISKYKKINIKGILLGAIAFVIIGSLGIALNTSNVISDKNVAKATTLQANVPITASKKIVDTTLSSAVSSAKKKSSSDNTNSIVPFLADIIIYNSHPNETYPSGMKITDVGALINAKLLKEGFNSHFIKIDQPVNYNNSYQVARSIITKNVSNYSNAILLDIHRDSAVNTTNQLQFVLTKNNPRYEANKKFVDGLLENIKDSNDVKTGIYFYEDGISYFNEDLSNSSALIELGNTTSSDGDINACVKALVFALKNTQKVLPN
ncbi:MULTISPECIES: M56 family metallopeptidase [Clostridium]|uniref:M56 family metallopeptidase n=1 Tax=Clostridium frigoriphilum TaxID=443253 RepID=A0ABU7UMA5_9CLOT|nr:M56 family metallopeptidase [Clostridium sp. DSM 17811]MBU3099984.1 stage II sporulation protein P [Clostridium sp. DSM 17811]